MNTSVIVVCIYICSLLLTTITNTLAVCIPIECDIQLILT